MRPHRNLKVGSLIENQLSLILARDFDSNGALVTVTNVFVSEDLLHAKAKIAIIPYDKEIEVYQKLSKERKHIEHLLFKKINIRPFPHIEFFIDSPDQKLKIRKKGQVAKW